MHLAILLWGFTGIFGKLINLGPEHIVWYRMLLSAASLWLILYFSGKFRILPVRQLWPFILIGGIVMIHWILFYAAIKVSNVSITLSCFSSITLFTALIEPLVNKRKVDRFELLFALMVIAGIYTIFAFQKIYIAGIILSLLSAVLGAVFTILNKRMLRDHEPALITFYELLAGFVLLTVLLPVYLTIIKQPIQLPGGYDIINLLLLSVFCTTVAFTISLIALKELNPFVLNLSINLEPVYSIILAISIFNEGKFLNAGFFAGTAILLSAVILHSVHQWYLYRKSVKVFSERKN